MNKKMNAILITLCLLMIGCTKTNDTQLDTQIGKDLTITEEVNKTNLEDTEIEELQSIENTNEKANNDKHFSSESKQEIQNINVTVSDDEQKQKETSSAPSSNDPNNNYKENISTVPTPKEESKQEPTPNQTPVVDEESKECPYCEDKSKPHDAVLDHNWYREILSSQAEADARGMYYLDEVMYIGDIEITNYSVQPVYDNHHNIVFYGLNLWNCGVLIA